MPKVKSAHLRTTSRVLALQALYEADVTGHPVGTSFGWFEREDRLPEDSIAYALELTEGVIHRQNEIDKFIHKYAPAWPVKQLPVVDRNILRLSLFEICFGRGIPRKVAINEAVELAKAFGSGSSPRFVNGVLGSVMDEMDRNSAGSTEPPPVQTDNICQKGK